MSDTTTIGEESDMLHLQSIFAKAANAIVEASQLRKEVAKLQDEMHSLSMNVESLRQSNETLVQELASIRQEKTELHNKLWQAEGEISQLKTALENSEKSRDDQGATIYNQALEIARLREEKGKLEGALHDAINHSANLAAQLVVIRDAHQGLVKAHEEFSKVVVGEVPPTPKWEEAKAAVQEATPEASPFGGDQGETALISGTSGEQPRAENGRFETIPMAAKDFEF